MDSTSTSVERNSKGRFQPGWRGGPGRPRNTIKMALQRSTKPLQVQAVLEKAHQAAMQGNVMAARLFLEYVIGKPRQMEQECAAIGELPALKSADDCLNAVSRILESATSGRLSVERAAQLCGMVDQARAALISRDLEARVKSLENN